METCDTSAVISRSEAKARGLTRFFLNTPCKRGHVAERNVRNGRCMMCRARMQKAHRRKPTYREWRRIWYAANRNRLILANAVARELRIDKHTREKEAAIRYYWRHREAQITRGKRWKQSHPEATSLYKARRRARQKGATGSHTRADLDAILKQQRHRCAYCRVNLKTTKKQKDHIIALARGGTDDKRNIQWLCASCNARKYVKHPNEFARLQGLLL